MKHIPVLMEEVLDALKPKKGHVIKVVTFFLGRTRQQEIEVSDEHEGFAWLSFEDAMERLTFDNAREMLRAAVSSMSPSSPKAT